VVAVASLSHCPPPSLSLFLSPPLPFPGSGNITGPAGCARESP